MDFAMSNLRTLDFAVNALRNLECLFADGLNQVGKGASMTSLSGCLTRNKI